jgi:hypothetical protein
MTDFEGSLRRLVRAFDAAGVPLMVVGSFASTARVCPWHELARGRVAVSRELFASLHGMSRARRDAGEAMNKTLWTLAAVVALGAACGGRTEGPGQGAGTNSGSSSGSGSGSGSGSSSGPEAGPPDASAAAELCTQTGGRVVQTFCSANPPFAQYTCASGENGALCTPAPGETNPATPECVCGSPGSTSLCFDPVKGCVARK